MPGYEARLGFEVDGSGDGVSSSSPGSAMSARRIAGNYSRDGLEAALYDRPRLGQPRRMRQKEISQIVVMVCASPPEGYAQWSVRLIAEESVRRKIVGKTNRESVRLILKNHELRPWLKKCGAWLS